MAQLPLEPTHIAGLLGLLAAAVKGFRMWQRGAKEAEADDGIEALANGKRQKLVEKLARLQTSSDDYLERIGALEADAEEGRRAHYAIREENRRIHESLDHRVSKLEKSWKSRSWRDNEA